MSWLVRRSLLMVLAAVVVGIGSGLIWPGDVNGEPISFGHWVAIAGFVTTAALLVVAAASMVAALVGGTWKVSHFNPNEYLERSKKGRM